MTQRAMLVSRAELNPRGYALTPTQVTNQAKLLRAINRVRNAYGKPMIVTSGVRSWEEHAAIYARQKRQPPKGSAHLSGAACDVFDGDKKLWHWCLDHLDLIRKWGLYLEDGNSTPNWLHFQVIPPASGNTVFIPFIKAAK